MSDAVYVGCSLDPFDEVRLPVWFDAGRRLHLDPSCTSAEGVMADGVVALADCHLHLRCAACATTAPAPAAIGHYAGACEDLARARGALDETDDLVGLDGLRGAVRALSFTAAASDGAVVPYDVEVERVAARLRQRCLDRLDAGHRMCRDLLWWAASFSVAVEHRAPVGVFEAARGALRSGDRGPLERAIGREVTDRWLSAIGDRVAEPGTVLCEVLADASDGTLVALATLSHRQHRHGRIFGACPRWVVDLAEPLGLPVVPSGPLDPDEPQRHVELFAALAERMTAPLAARVGRRLARQRPTGPVAYGSAIGSWQDVAGFDDPPVPWWRLPER